jgi:cystathionine beta-lyase
MWIADMDFMAPESVIEAIRQRNEHGIFGYAASLPESYCTAITEWADRRHQWKIRSDWFNCTPGVVPALSAAVLTYTEPGDGIIIQPPVYPPFYSVIRENGRRVLENPLRLVKGCYFMDFDNLEEQIRAGAKLLILCSPHNPSGRVWKSEELAALGELCLKNGIIIVSDEIHSDIIYKGHKHLPLASVSDELAQNSVTCIAASKTFGIAGLAASTIIIPDRGLREKFKRRIQCLGIDSVNIFGLTASEAAYRYGEGWLEQLLGYLTENLRILEEYFHDNIPEIVPVHPDGTYLVWLDCRRLGLNSGDLNEFMAKKAKVGLNSGATFGEQGEGFLRINIACPRALLLDGLGRITTAVRNMKL